MIFFIFTLALTGGLLMLGGATAEHRVRRVQQRVGNPMPVVAAAISGGSVALMVTAVPVFALLSGLACAFIPRLHRRRKVRAQQVLAEQAWPGVLDDITSAVRAGLNLPEALALAGSRAPQQLQAGFAGFAADYRRSGDFTSSLERTQLAIADPVFDQLANALTIARKVGGHDLTQVLRSLGTFIRADLQIRGELLARQSWSVNAARMAVAAPWVVLVLLSTRPATLVAYRSVAGSVVLLVVAAGSVIAYLAMLRIARLDRTRS